MLILALILVDFLLVRIRQITKESATRYLYTLGSLGSIRKISDFLFVRLVGWLEFSFSCFVVSLGIDRTWPFKENDSLTWAQWTVLSFATVSEYRNKMKRFVLYMSCSLGILPTFDLDNKMICKVHVIKKFIKIYQTI